MQDSQKQISMKKKNKAGRKKDATSFAGKLRAMKAGDTITVVDKTGQNIASTIIYIRSQGHKGKYTVRKNVLGGIGSGMVENDTNGFH